MAEIHAIVALRFGGRIVSRQHEILLSNIPLLDRFFEDYGTWFEWIRPKSGCVGFVKFEGRPSVDDLAQQLIEQSGVFVMPASAFEFSGEFFRIGFGRTTMPESLERFMGFVENNKSDW